MSGDHIFTTLAEALEAAAQVLRDQAGSATGPASDATPADFAQLGFRQRQILGVLAEHPDGTNTGVISRAIRYSQPNVHLTLKSLIDRGLVEKFASERPHRYKLARH